MNPIAPSYGLEVALTVRHDENNPPNWMAGDPVDLQAAESVDVFLRRPGQPLEEVPAGDVTIGADGLLTLVISAADPGTYRAEAYVTLQAGKAYASSTHTFEVDQGIISKGDIA